MEQAPHSESLEEATQPDLLAEYGDRELTVFGVSGTFKELAKICPVDLNDSSVSLQAKNDFVIKAANEAGLAIAPEHESLFAQRLEKQGLERHFTVAPEKPPSPKPVDSKLHERTEPLPNARDIRAPRAEIATSAIIEAETKHEEERSQARPVPDASPAKRRVIELNISDEALTVPDVKADEAPEDTLIHTRETPVRAAGNPSRITADQPAPEAAQASRPRQPEHPRVAAKPSITVAAIETIAPRAPHSKDTAALVIEKPATETAEPVDTAPATHPEEAMARISLERESEAGAGHAVCSAYKRFSELVQDLLATPATPETAKDYDFSALDQTAPELTSPEPPPTIVLTVNQHLIELPPDEREAVEPLLEEITETVTIISTLIEESAEPEALEAVTAELEEQVIRLFEELGIAYEPEDTKRFVAVLLGSKLNTEPLEEAVKIEADLEHDGTREAKLGWPQPVAGILANVEQETRRILGSIALLRSVAGLA